jgi:hypothetical protein
MSPKLIIPATVASPIATPVSIVSGSDSFRNEKGEKITERFEYGVMKICDAIKLKALKQENRKVSESC